MVAADHSSFVESHHDYNLIKDRLKDEGSLTGRQRMAIAKLANDMETHWFTINGSVQQKMTTTSILG